MADRPIIFSAPMVSALLAGRKTQTRRLALTRHHVLIPADNADEWLDLGWNVTEPDDTDTCIAWRERPSPWWAAVPGDQLWVREAWQDYCPLWEGAWCGHGTHEGIVLDHRPVYRADPAETWLRGPEGKEQPPTKWRPSIHMPRWASRLTLTVTDVRVQRLQEITFEDAVAEGATSRPNCNGYRNQDLGWSMNWSEVGALSRFAGGVRARGHEQPLTEHDISCSSPRYAFASLWNSIHGPDAWEADPAVVRICFDCERRNIDSREPT